MSAVQEPGPQRAQRERRRPNLPVVLIDRWAQLAAERPWRYLAIWAIGIGAANLGLRLLLNDRSLARNASLAILTAVGFWAVAWVHTVQLTRSARGRRPRPAANPAIPKPNQGCATGWHAGSPGRRPSSGRSARSQGHGRAHDGEGATQTGRRTARAIRVPAAPGPGHGRRRHHPRPPCWCHS
jgi:hypothetical protein